ncbi:MAG: hypothetical protein DMG57_13560 [Acidobacteria bacterium]|nr:MAG: hypothetical protein DMG57_13560 [Acidobacteriota bacterium]
MIRMETHAAIRHLRRTPSPVRSRRTHLIRAMRNVHAHLLIIGEGPLDDRLVAVALECGATANVTFLGNIEDIAPYYHAADIFVLPSVARSEAFGIVQLEAMACGKPVVNTALASGVPFVSVDGITGITVPPADSDALAVALNLLLENAELRARFGKAGEQPVESGFNLPEMARRTFDLYQETFQNLPKPDTSR